MAKTVLHPKDVTREALAILHQRLREKWAAEEPWRRRWDGAPLVYPLGRTGATEGLGKPLNIRMPNADAS